MMKKRSSSLVLMLISFSCFAYAASGSGAIGTVSARGDLRVDGYTVAGNGTLFDGTAVQTDQANATLRLDNGTEVTLSINSRGVVYRDHLVLLQGKSQLKASSSPFLLEADGLRVSPSGPNTLGVVSVGSADTVDVAALAGEFRIVDGAGSSLAHISPGTAMSFHLAGSLGAQSGTSITEVGVVSRENGIYYLETSDGTKYQLEGKDFQKFDGKKVAITGRLQGGTTPSGGSEIIVSTININGEGGAFSSAGKVWLITALVAGGAGAGIGIYEATKSPASK
jgi:hypothetical protein